MSGAQERLAHAYRGMALTWGKFVRGTYYSPYTWYMISIISINNKLSSRTLSAVGKARATKSLILPPASLYTPYNGVHPAES